MKALQGKTAIVSGGAEGIGLAIAHELGRHEMNIVIADINEAQLQQAKEGLEASGFAVLAVILDVADSAQWKELATQAVERFGKVHMLVNNAGVGGAPSPIDTSNENDWRWIVDVNLMGVVHGAQTVIPLIREHGEGGWMINVASMAGFVALPMASGYSATKAAVVAMSECWYTELQEHNIHVSVLCPGFVKTRINLSQRNKQAQYSSGNEASEQTEKQGKRESAQNAQMQAVIDAGSEPALIAERVVEALAAKELYIITHPNFRSTVQGRFTEITDSFVRAESSAVLAGAGDQKVPTFE